jgi:hypothetical protein
MLWASLVDVVVGVAPTVDVVWPAVSSLPELLQPAETINAARAAAQIGAVRFRICHPPPRFERSGGRYGLIGLATKNQ